MMYVTDANKAAVQRWIEAFDDRGSRLTRFGHLVVEFEFVTPRFPGVRLSAGVQATNGRSGAESKAVNRAPISI